MKRLFFFFWFGLGCLYSSNAQQIALQFHLIDETTKTPITDAHIFISDSSLGTTSDINGYCELSITAEETQVLIITHVSYETLVIGPERYKKLVNSAILELQANGLDLNEIQLIAKRSNQWKKRFKKFRKALLGDDKAAASCRILNPEVIRFEEKDGILWASAIDLLHIENDYLGYTIRFWLAELSIEMDGSTYFRGYGQFIDKAEVDDAKHIKRRDRIYKHSLPHFLRSLLASPDKAALKNYGYQVAYERYNEGEFIAFVEPEPNALFLPDTSVGFYRLYFSEFLAIKHKGLKVSPDGETKIAVSGLEQQRFGTGRNESLGTSMQNAVSRLYKIEPYLLFDQRGNIINKNAVREYGYWAAQRLAATLPIDYKSSTVLNTLEPKSQRVDTLEIFQHLIGYDQQKKIAALQFLQDNWSQTYIAPLLDILRLSQDDWQQQKIQDLLNEHVPAIEANYFNGIQWLWENPPNYGHYYSNFKAYLYSALDPIFNQYFSQRRRQANIRLDEIVWGGVKQDGIPPLRSPKMISPTEAKYLSDSDVVFGLVIDGEAKAYPKRILAWHEFFTDDIGEYAVAGVYCTLCGTLIVYDTEFNGIKHQLGTSGFLYRSNKLMYDKATQSLWSTILGRPVVGPLINQDIELSVLPVETTSWGEWQKRHPNTQVLSLETGYSRNYAEGEAYKDYFSKDDLMFPVPKLDKRLPNKARVFVPRPENFEAYPLAISVDFLRRKRIHQDQIGEQRLVIITENTGASRAYAINDQQFKSYKLRKLLDKKGEHWEVTEEALIGPQGQRLNRIPAHEAFWFAWINVFPLTRIIY